MKKSLKNYGPYLIAIAAILWAFDGILRRSLYSLQPIIIVYYEHLIGSILLIPVLFQQWKKLKMTKSDISLILLVSLLSGLIGTLLFTTALLKVEFIPFSVVILLQKLQPLFAISFAAIFLKEKITKVYIKWAVLALIAAFFVTFPYGKININSGSETIIAALFAVGAAAAWGSSTVFSRKLLMRNPAGPITSLRFMYTTLFAGIFIVLTNQTAYLASPDFSQIVRLCIIALSTGMVALFIYYQGLRKTEAKVSTIIELIFPLLAVFIDIYLYHTVLNWSQYLAAGILVFAIYRVSLLNRS